jgi:hypothetical protein
MALRTTYSAESWDAIYQSFAAVNFTSFDFDTIKQSLVTYTQTYYPEQFNDYIQSSEFIAMLEMFAYIAEQLAYRIDMVAHENMITTAQRKQSILRLAKLISYKATRNIPVRGLVKLNTITTSERILDSRGTNLAGLTITWNDPNNANWKEQFTLIMNRILATRFGQPSKTVQVGDVVMDLYSLQNDPSKVVNGVLPFTVSTGLESFPMEVVPADIDSNGPFEREPDINSSMSLIYANDGIGDGSDYTGFLMFIKQGVLTRVDYDITQQLPDARFDFSQQNVNNTDVWVQTIDTSGTITERWTQVDTVADENLVFNSNRSTRNKYEVDTRENDQVTFIFGDGDFSTAPVGLYRFWMRQSANRSLVIQKNKITNQSVGFTYTSSIGNVETSTFTFSLTSTLQNGSASEDIEHIRRSAPAAHYAQGRMVNGQDYNTYPLSDPSILRLKTINRTFAGQPKYIDWNDASGQYENVKLFGDDLVMRYQITQDTQTTSLSGQSLIDEVIEPLLKTSGVVNTMLHISAGDPDTVGIVSAPRRKFIEDNRGARYYKTFGQPVTVLGTGNGSLKEKTAMQGLIDRHWYGEALSIVQATDGTLLGLIPDPGLFPEDDSRIYNATLPRTIDGVNKYPPGDIGSGLQPVAEQNYFGLRYNRVMGAIGDGTMDATLAGSIGSQELILNETVIGTAWNLGGYYLPNEVWTIEVQADGLTLAVRSNLRGSFPSGTVGDTYQIQPAGFSASVSMFKMANTGTVNFDAGDAFILETKSDGSLRVRNSSVWGTKPINLNGWWEVMDTSVMPNYASGMKNAQIFTTSENPAVGGSTGASKEDSWVIFVRKIRQGVTGTVIGYEVVSRDLKLTVESDTTNFWYNSVDQLLDSDTKKRVFDNVKILRSNLDTNGAVLGTSQIYDVVGAVADDNGVVDFHQLEIVPSDLLQEDDSGDLIPDRLLQYETFAAGSYEYFTLASPTVILTGSAALSAAGAFISGDAATVSDNGVYGRNLRMPALSSSQADQGLDFMWQHFTPFNNIIDPSVTNIHDAYVMTAGYYNNVISYVRGLSTSAPTAPTPLELQNSYGAILQSKMLSDTVVFHPGKLRLLFGSLAEPQMRAKFTVVKAQSATLTNERIKEEILNVINTFFDIDNWDFGQTFYATQLTTLIHQRLPADVASVVLVPQYSTNSFGSLFTVESGIDEILQSAAELSDIVIVDALTPTVIRQS